MRQYRVLLTLVGAFSLIGMAACGGGGKYGEIKRVLGREASVMETFTSQMDAVKVIVNADGKRDPKEWANNCKKVAAAMNAYVDGMNDLAPQLKVMPEKLSDLATTTNYTVELHDVGERLMYASLKFSDAVRKSSWFSREPEIEALNQRFNEALGLQYDPFQPSKVPNHK
jgi:hypothetical protein